MLAEWPKHLPIPLVKQKGVIYPSSSEPQVTVPAVHVAATSLPPCSQRQSGYKETGMTQGDFNNFP